MATKVITVSIPLLVHQNIQEKRWSPSSIFMRGYNAVIGSARQRDNFEVENEALKKTLEYAQEEIKLYKNLYEKVDAKLKNYMDAYGVYKGEVPK